MTTTSMDKEDLFSTIDEGCLVLTPNHRMAFQLLDQYGRHREQLGLPPVCPSPKVFPVDIWIRQQWDKLAHAAHNAIPAVNILEPGHEQLVWQQIIRQSDSGTALLNLPATARAIQQTWSLINLWQITRDELRPYAAFRGAQAHDDLRAYMGWSDAFNQFCQKHQLITLVQLLEFFITLLEQNVVPLPEKVILIGFSAPPPIYLRLLDAIAKKTTHCQHYKAPDYSPQQRCEKFDDVETEFEAAARWAHNASQEAGSRIGIIIPELHRYRNTVQRIFSRIFHPDESRSLRARDNYRFTLSAGESLNNKPLIHAALQCLRRNQHTISTLESIVFLRLPFLAGAEEEEVARGELEFRIRRDNPPFLNNTDLRYLAGQENSNHFAPMLVDMLLNFDQVRPVAADSHRATTLFWSECFERQLEALGWPGTRPLSNAEKNHLTSWQLVLASFQSLSAVFGDIGLDDALELLEQLVSASSSNPVSSDNPVQILSPTEAQGLQFTHCWITGMSEQSWPPRPSPSPFLPYALQKEKGIPDADVTSHSQAMNSLIQSFIASTDTEATLSYTLMDGDIEQKPAAIYRQQLLSAATESVSHPEPGSAQAIPIKLPVCETFDDPGFFPLLPQEQIRGGSALLTDQAACPFRSFARHRLGARDVEPLVPGLSASAAGSLLHLALDLLWQKLQDQNTLSATDAATRDHIIDSVVSEAIRLTANRYRHTMTIRFCQLEHSRLKELLLQWLEEEEKRGSFKVLAREHDTVWEHGNLSLKLRIDRVDQVHDDELVLIDYKSAAKTAVDWEDPRPGNPQLMLYTLAVEQAASLPIHQVSGTFFAQVNIEKTAFNGLTAHEGIYPGASVGEQAGKRSGLSENANWQELKKQWEASLGVLAEEFLAGRLVVDPKNTGTCDYCQIKPFCRVSEVMSE